MIMRLEFVYGIYFASFDALAIFRARPRASRMAICRHSFAEREARCFPAKGPAHSSNPKLVPLPSNHWVSNRQNIVKTRVKS